MFRDLTKVIFLEIVLTTIDAEVVSTHCTGQQSVVGGCVVLLV